MNKEMHLSDEQWSAIFPFARLYVYYIFPVVVFLLFCSFAVLAIRGSASLQDLVVIVLLASFSWLYERAFKNLREKRPVHLSAGVWIRPGDSIVWGRLMVGVVVCGHFCVHLAAIISNLQRW